MKPRGHYHEGEQMSEAWGTLSGEGIGGMNLGDIIRRREWRSEAWGTLSEGGSRGVKPGGQYQEEVLEKWSLGDIIRRKERRSGALETLS